MHLSNGSFISFGFFIVFSSISFLRNGRNAFSNIEGALITTKAKVLRACDTVIKFLIWQSLTILKTLRKENKKHSREISKGKSKQLKKERSLNKSRLKEAEGKILKEFTTPRLNQLLN